ncbi:hypothetical protein BC938DRAFT_470687 [Jimgerdemannia flammicorona]|uniref:Uncharacterized protein n=1 Tax=Jimgerdemannia flammicorona TaxID=994334 RepID=A0A433Q9P2_9FUNG|nr:hypothetical protein BC938DRAFT_470687 [Jimgerdemannia flammicorona]
MAWMVATRGAPRILPDKEFLRLLLGSIGGSVGVLNDDIEHLGEVLAQAVRCARLDPTARRRNEAFHRRRVQPTGELLLFRLHTLHNRDSEEILVDLRVERQDLTDLDVGLRLGQVRRVALLP